MNEKRLHQRLELYSSAMVTQGGRAWLCQVEDVSSGGARIVKPLDWVDIAPQPFWIYFVIDQETVVGLRASIVRDGPEHLGFRFKSGQEEEIARLLYETRFAMEVL